MKKKRGCGAAAAGAALVLGMVGSAQGAPVYAIATLGLTDAEHTRSTDGYRESHPHDLNLGGQATGRSIRFNAGGGSSGESVWIYNGNTTLKIGLTDAEHTGANGYQYSLFTSFLTPSGQVVGISERYNAGVYNGRSAWRYSGSTTQNIGLTDSEHTGSNEYRDSFAQALNLAGQTIGYSSRFSASGTQNGRSAWLFDGTATKRIGLVDSDHTGTNGVQDSQAAAVNADGQAVGYSLRYSSSGSSNGRSAWFYGSSASVRIGLTDADHTGPNGYQYSDVQALNHAGQVIGSSQRASASLDNNGYSAWIYNSGTTQNIGLTDAEHTGTGSYRFSRPVALSEAGHAIGSSDRFNGETPSGRSAWLYENSETKKIGLTDAEHTRTGGYQYNDVSGVTDAGQVIGYSWRYNGDIYNGRSAWLHKDSTTHNIGLTDDEHTGISGYQESGFSGSPSLNAAGQAIGFSYRFNNSGDPNGYSAWLYDGSTTRKIGLTDADHTGNGEYRESEVQTLNEAGHAIGYSVRYSVNGYLGQDAWFYDSATQTTYALGLSERSDGYADSLARYLGEDGLVLGEYRLFDGMKDEGRRAFYFTMADGPLDLGLLIAEGLDASGWLYLADAVRANGINQILGNGVLKDEAKSQMSFLMTVVPLPPAIWFLASAIGAMLLGLRRPC